MDSGTTIKLLVKELKFISDNFNLGLIFTQSFMHVQAS